jgi:membrane protease YdiL (CAAX protease family)
MYFEMRERSSTRSTFPQETYRNSGITWAWFTFLTQIPFVFWYAKGGPALHPIVVMLPLVGLLNFNVEKRGPEGVGFRLVRPGRSLLLAMIFAALSCIGWWLALQIEDLPFQATGNDAIGRHLIESFFVDVFIIALWEEVVNQGYIQTRLQSAWGIKGVIVTAILFATMHIPSALLEHDNDILRPGIRFFETGMAGFALG